MLSNMRTVIPTNLKPGPGASEFGKYSGQTGKLSKLGEKK